MGGIWRGPRFCERHPEVRLKPKQTRFCSAECYNESGKRVEIGKKSGKKASVNFWKRWFFEFEEKYGHLRKEDAVKLAFRLGVKHAYSVRGTTAAKSRRSAAPNTERPALSS